jgi:hypothetical protein
VLRGHLKGCDAEGMSFVFNTFTEPFSSIGATYIFIEFELFA